MRTFKYKTLGGILKQSATDFTFDNFLSGRFTHKTHGWVSFKLSDEARDEAARKWADVLYARAGEQRTAKVRNYRGRNYGIFRRLAMTRKGKAYYCAGQDYPSEIRLIQGLIR